MKFPKLTIAALTAATFSAATACASSHNIIVENPSALDCSNEMASVNAAELSPLTSGSFRITDPDGKEVPYQLTYNGLIIFPVSVAAGRSVSYAVAEGAPAPVDTLVYGRQFPERKDDMSWENDRAAYRAYGPALQRSGERGFGYDVWTKCVPTPVLEKRYHLHLKENISFHADHGEGMDVYAVGPTLGAGTPALLNPADSSIIYPYCYESYEILDRGPLRFTVRLTYPPVKIGADTAVVETRIISLDRGSCLNSSTVSYSGLSREAKVAPGIVVHRQNPDGYTLNGKYRYMAYADSTENASAGNGIIYIGVVAPSSEDFICQPLPQPAGDAIAHLLAPASYSPGSGYAYFWGSAWSKGGMESADLWNRYLENYSYRLAHPLKVSVN